MSCPRCLQMIIHCTQTPPYCEQFSNFICNNQSCENFAKSRWFWKGEEYTEEQICKISKKLNQWKVLS